MNKLLALFLLIGCTSAPKKKTYNVDDIKNEDFKKMKTIGYSKQDDIFKQVKSDFTDALNEESIDRVFRYDGEVEGKGVMSQILRLCYQKRFKQAHILISNNAKIYSKNPIYWNQVGTCFLLEDNRRKALLFYNRALSLKSNYVPALNNLGVMYMKENDFSRALVAFKRAKKSANFSRTPRFNLANLYLSFGLYGQAEGLLKTLAEFSNKDIDVLNMLATSQLMQGKSAQAVSTFSRINKDMQERANIGINYALALYQTGKPAEARDMLEDIDGKTLSHWKRYYQKVSKYIGGKL